LFVFVYPPEYGDELDAVADTVEEISSTIDSEK